MKKLMSAILLMSFISPVAFAKMEIVPGSRWESYEVAIYSQNLSCPSFLSTVFLSTSEIAVDKTGAQPAIRVRAQGGRERYDLTLYTSPDQQRVISGTAESFRLTEVNRGTIVAPKIVSEWISNYKSPCGPIRHK